MIRELPVAAIAFAAVLVGGCGIQSYVPDAEILLSPDAPSRAFIISDREVRGIYANMDVDSTIYQYVTETHNSNKFWELVHERARQDGWMQIENRDLIRIYDRVVAAKGQQRFHSAEQVRIAYRPGTGAVTVAWVQVDSSQLLTRFPRQGVEADFAMRVVWPQFDELTK